MRKLCLILMLVSICTACEKDIPLGTLSASADGNERNFTSDPKAEWTSDPDGYDLWIHGMGTLNEISISINSQTRISAKTYNYVTFYFYRYILFLPVEYSTTPGTVVIDEVSHFMDDIIYRKSAPGVIDDSKQPFVRSRSLHHF